MPKNKDRKMKSSEDTDKLKDYIEQKVAYEVSLKKRELELTCQKEHEQYENAIRRLILLRNISLLVICILFFIIIIQIKNANFLYNILNNII